MSTNGQTYGQGAASPNIRVAIADDHPIFRDGLRRMLSIEADLDVVSETQDGSGVPGMLRSHNPDVLLLDLKMPNLDGLSVLQELQQVDHTTKVIVLTASEDQNQFVQAMRLGALGIVMKATATKTLVDGIRAVHTGGIWLDSHTAAAVLRVSAPLTHTSAPKLRGQAPALSEREREIVRLVGLALKNKEIAARTMLHEQTVKNYIHAIYDKLRVHNRLGLALYAIEHKLVSEEEYAAASASSGFAN